MIRPRGVSLLDPPPLPENIVRLFPPPVSRAGSGNKEEVARLVETLALGSVGESTQKNYLGKWNVWVKERRSQGKGPWLHENADPDQVLGELLEFMASRCFVHSNQQSTVRGYLAAIKYFHKMYAG